MDRLDRFFCAVRTEATAMLATAANGRVTMRTVSPSAFADGVLLFTDASSLKYRQLAENPSCCLSVGGYFAEATVQFRGPTMADENAALREAYSDKFPDAFTEGAAFGGRNAEFILLTPVRLSGWDYPDGAPAADFPTVPFEWTRDSDKMHG